MSPFHFPSPAHFSAPRAYLTGVESRSRQSDSRLRSCNVIFIMCHVVKHQFERDADSMSDKVRLCAGHDSTGPWAINSQARALGARALKRGASWCVASVRQLVR